MKNNRLPKGIGSVSTRVYMSTRKRSALDRWENARFKRKIFDELQNNKKQSSLRQFSNKKNPLDDNLITYDVSAQVDYESSQGGIYSQGNTFKVIGFNNISLTESITSQTKSAYGSMKLSGNDFSNNLKSAIENNTKVNINRVRGLEKGEKPRLKNSEYEKLLNGGIITKDLNSQVTISKNKNGRKYGNYKANLDLTNFR